MSQDTLVRQIALTRGMVALVSDEDYERLSHRQHHGEFARPNFPEVLP